MRSERCAAALAALGALALVLAGCDGSGSPAPASTGSSAVSSTAVTSDLATSTAPTTSTPAPGPSSSSGPTQASEASCLPTAGHGADAITSCLSRQLAAFWTARLHRRVRVLVDVHPGLSTLPKDCQGATLPPVAFECPENHYVYFPATERERLARSYHGAALVYAYAYVMGHETGHVVQDALRQPARRTLQKLSTERASHVIEQQADCLSGVWAHHTSWLVPAAFLASATTEITAISSHDEIVGHGTPAQRRAAVHRGLLAGRPAVCGITGVG